MAIISNPDRYIKQALQMRYNSFMEKIKDLFGDLTSEELKEYLNIDTRTDKQLRDKARQTQELIDMNIKETGGIGKNPTSTSFYSGENAAKDLSNDRPTIVKREKKKPYVRRF